jgi:hypothetical protein
MKRPLGLVAMLALAACGGGDDDGGDGEDLENPGFATPDEVTTAYMQEGTSWTLVGAADWSCLGTPSDDQPSSLEITVSGIARDFQEDEDTIAGAMISVYEGSDIAGTPIDEVVAEADGSFSVTLPEGTERVAFKTAADGYLDTYLMNQYYQPDEAAQEENLEPISESLANALTAFTGRTTPRTLGLGVLAGAIRDCEAHEVKGAIATVSSVSGEAVHLDGAESYYFSAGSQSLPVRLTVSPYTNDDGLFMVMELPPSDDLAYLQVWGFVDGQDPESDDMTLLAELPMPVIGDTVVSASMEALRE